MKLSRNFTLSEFLQSDTAARNDISMFADEQIVENLTQLTTSILQPLRDAIDIPIRITSGYRPPRLNALIGGSKTSSHMRGMAADIVVPGMEPRAVVDALGELNIIYDQIILEFSSWTHIGISHRPRYEKLTAYREKGRTVYKEGWA